MSPRGWSIARRLFAIDILTMAFAAALGGGTVARSAQIPEWHAVALTCAAITAIVPLLGWLRAHLDVVLTRVLHDWSFALCLYVIYRMVVHVAGPSHLGHLFDGWFVAADRWLFGVDPAIWFARVAHPIVTGILRLAHASFYLLPLAVTVELYAGEREWRFRQWAFVCGSGFFASYAAHLVLPTAVLGIAAVVLLSMAWSWRCRLRVRWVVTVGGALLVPAGVYLRYDYVSGVLAGAALAILCLVLAPPLHGWLSRHLGTLDSDPKR